MKEGRRLVEPASSYNIVFCKEGGKEVGRIYWDNGVLQFKGKMEESARLFFDFLLEKLIDPYVKEKLSKR